MHYELNLTLEPDRHYLHVNVQIQGIEGNIFYLNESFRILSVTSGGTPIPWHMDKLHPHPMADPVSRPIFFETEGKTIELEYEGFLSETVLEVNQLNPLTIELSYYSGWYPKPAVMEAPFDFLLNVSLPTGYEIISNGKIHNQAPLVLSGRDIDIVFFASKEVECVSYSEAQIRCTFYSPPQMRLGLERRARALISTHQFYTECYGPIYPEGGVMEIISVFRPSGGWGYKRGNLSLLPAVETTENFRHDFHELAHGWWNIAGTAHDWINEAGAEFSAFSAAARLSGDAFIKDYLTQSMAQIQQGREPVSIVDTPYTSPERYLNHYTKTTVMLVLAQQKFGDSRVFLFLRTLFQTFQNTRMATTTDFLALCDDEMRAFFTRYLYAPGWDGLNYCIEVQGL